MHTCSVEVYIHLVTFCIDAYKCVTCMYILADIFAELRLFYCILTLNKTTSILESYRAIASYIMARGPREVLQAFYNLHCMRTKCSQPSNLR